ncbi:hypothetical protein RKE29_07125 [Streptomyces sp. B1866]|uniref:hypothetical protein n=1 Tax=Streptomyces sp. B1866 TaxID=3075431 RepID=UPI002892254A|nr:hypothetical protein [Streptomyces sp. B1866]MDT3396414.1 hypothetical protein [Streptomyces sp. B1866]
MTAMTIRVYRFDPETGERVEVSSCSYLAEPRKSFVPASPRWPRCECSRCREGAGGECGAEGAR